MILEAQLLVMREDPEAAHPDQRQTLEMQELMLLVNFVNSMIHFLGLISLIRPKRLMIEYQFTSQEVKATYMSVFMEPVIQLCLSLSWQRFSSLPTLL